MLLKNKIRDNYSIIANAGMRDKRLSWKAKGMLAWLCTHKESFALNIEALKLFGTDGDRSSRAGISELKEFGYLVFEGQLREEDGSMGRSIYRIIPEPDSCYPNVGNARADNVGGISNTNRRNTNKSRVIGKTENFENSATIEDRISKTSNRAANTLMLNLHDHPWLIEWLEYLYNELDTPAGAIQIKKLMDRVLKWSADDRQAAVDHSISNGYKGLILPPGKQFTSPKNTGHARSEEKDIKDYYSKR